MMTTGGTLIFLGSLAVLSGAAQGGTESHNCSATLDLKQLSSELQEAVKCGDALGLNCSRYAEVLSTMKSLSDMLHNLAECSSTEPAGCPVPGIPSNGGLVCITVCDKLYCKPMCNEGHDFAFLRRSRLYEECSADTRFKWTTQYVGGNTLAECFTTVTQVSGGKTAYFPNGQNCYQTKNDSNLEKRILDTFTTELRGQGISGVFQCPRLMCGPAY